MKIVCLTFVVLFANLCLAQNVQFSFANPELTSENGTDYFELDVLIASQTESGSFIMSSGQLYLNYNENAFGQQIFQNGKIEVSSPDGYLLGLKDNSAEIMKVYSDPLLNDNAPNRISIAWQQDRAGNCISQEITEIPIPLMHLKFSYIADNELPELCFESSEIFRKQTYTLCGEYTGPCGFAPANCTNFPGLRIMDDVFDCSGALSCTDFDVAYQTVPPTDGNDGMIVLNPTGGQAPYQVLWATGETDMTLGNLNEGSYDVTVTDALGCETMLSITLLSTSIEALGISEIDIYPIPAEDVLYLEIENLNPINLRLEITNVLGTRLFQQNLNLEIGKRIHTITLDNIAQGAYFMNLLDENNQIIYSREFVKIQ